MDSLIPLESKMYSLPQLLEINTKTRASAYGKSALPFLISFLYRKFYVYGEFGQVSFYAYQMKLKFCSMNKIYLLICIPAAHIEAL